MMRTENLTGKINFVDMFLLGTATEFELRVVSKRFICGALDRALHS
jgi:hypothetical protein